MAKKNTAKKGEAKTVNVTVSPAVNPAEEEIAKKDNEMVNEIGINMAIAQEVKKEAPAQNIQKASDYTVILNTSQNPILLQGENENDKILIAPKEIKSVKRSLLKELLKNKIVRYWFDKGVLSTNKDANEVAAHDAQVPLNLTQPVERHDGANVSASVTKFEKQGNITINL